MTNTSHIWYSIIILRKRTLPFLVEVKGYGKSLEVIRRKLCKHNISRYEVWILFILAIRMRYIQNMNSIFFGTGQKLSELTGSENTKPGITPCKHANSR